MKQCNRCGEWLPADAFSKNQAKCRSCRIVVNAEWQKQNREYVREYRKRYLKPRKREVLAVGLKRCSLCQQVKSTDSFYQHQHHRDGLDNWCKPCNRQNNDRWKAEHPEKNAEILRRWKERNPDRKRELSQKASKRRSIVKKTRGSYTTAEWRALCIKHNHCCLACGKAEPDIRLTPDHIQPLMKGGANTIDNLQPLCLECNVRKGSKTVDYRPKEETCLTST